MDRGNKRRRDDAEPVKYFLHPHLEKGRREANRSPCDVIVDLNLALDQEADLPLLNEDGSPVSMATSSSSGSSRASRDGVPERLRVVTAQDRPTMEAFPFHLASGLKVYEQRLPVNGSKSKEEMMFCGIECVSCRQRFRKFPRSESETKKAIVDFQKHLPICGGSRGIRRYLRWMEERGFNKDRKRWFRPLAERIYARMKQIEREGDEMLKGMEARAKKKARRQKQKKSHSVLESVGLVEPRSAWL